MLLKLKQYISLPTSGLCNPKHSSSLLWHESGFALTTISWLIWDISISIGGTMQTKKEINKKIGWQSSYNQVKSAVAW